MVSLPGLDRTTDAAIERTPDGRRIVVSRAVDAPVETCWDLLIDTDRWPAWGPSVTAVACDERYISAGTTGRVRVVGGVWLPFEITSCRDYRWTWRVARIRATGHVVRPGTPPRIGFEIPPVAAAYVPVCVQALRNLAALANAVTVSESS